MAKNSEKYHCPYSHKQTLCNGSITPLILDYSCVNYNEEQAHFEFRLCAYNCSFANHYICQQIYHIETTTYAVILKDLEHSVVSVMKIKNIHPPAYSFDILQ